MKDVNTENSESFPPLSIQTGSSVNLIRGTLDCFPKKGDISKLFLSSIYRSKSFESNGSAHDRLMVYSPKENHETILRSHFSHTMRISLSDFYPEYLWEISDKRTLLAIHTQYDDISHNPHLKQLAKIYSGLQPAEFNHLIREMWNRGTREPLEQLSGPYSREPVILSEKSGKMKLWSMASSYRDQFSKKYKHYRFEGSPQLGSNIEEGISAGISEPGRGIGCLFISPDTSATSASATQRKTIIHHQIKIPDSGIVLDAPMLFAKDLSAWILSQHLNQKIDHIYLINPFWHLSYLFRESLLQLDELIDLDASQFLFPDLLLGWSPELSLIQFLSDQSHCSLFVDFTRYPSINVLMSRKDSDFEN